MSAVQSPKTLDQLRAKHAWDAVQEIKEKDGAGDFGGHAKKLPMRIRAAGLGQALAFINAKTGTDNSKPGMTALLTTLNDWVLIQRGLAPEADPQQHDTLIKQICERDAAFLKRATLEIMAYLQWLNRFAEAEGLGGTEPEDAAQ